MRRKDSTVN